MSGGGGSSTFRVPIPNNVRKTIQDIREITGKQHTDDEIYAVLKECSMDPNETAQKLLYLEFQLLHLLVLQTNPMGSLFTCLLVNLPLLVYLKVAQLVMTLAMKKVSNLKLLLLPHPLSLLKPLA
ncbi:hypothetical protein V8G54_035836 [Vigna mungo]|uniref:GBF-interacting protein 1 N-terminal domain-containing protein n=1 Tax=Vigna mungo TaxID=3915 RepID=A0AAQ3MFS4_VIGMU